MRTLLDAGAVEGEEEVLGAGETVAGEFVEAEALFLLEAAAVVILKGKRTKSFRFYTKK